MQRDCDNLRADLRSFGPGVGLRGSAAGPRANCEPERDLTASLPAWAAGPPRRRLNGCQEEISQGIAIERFREGAQCFF